ncbi:glycosyltransferase family 2 protein [Mucilaginibacter calamicampi]|uniref:Glycosyltransferase family 2 protein n=1 Tax=Mucilaginibacter calamicampi TaxID=1302352 RepID=A0ABW2YT72_9SPHI
MLSIIIPTIGKKIPELTRLFDSLAQQTCQEFEAILAIQDNHAQIEQLTLAYQFPIKICNLYKKGLSYARNQSLGLISNAATLVTFSDDDCWYPLDTVATVLADYQQYNTSICYQIFDPLKNEPYKEYQPNKLEQVSLRQSLKISSIEIFVPKTVIDSGICFDERFGLGTAFPSGEENIFLFDAIKAGVKILYFPKPIVYHQKPEWSNKEYIFKGKGALFSKLYNRPLALMMSVFYAYKKREYSQNIMADLLRMINEAIYFKN